MCNCVVCVVDYWRVYRKHSVCITKESTLVDVTFRIDHCVTVNVSPIFFEKMTLFWSPIYVSAGIPKFSAQDPPNSEDPWYLQCIYCVLLLQLNRVCWKMKMRELFQKSTLLLMRSWMLWKTKVQSISKINKCLLMPIRSTVHEKIINNELSIT